MADSAIWSRIESGGGTSSLNDVFTATMVVIPEAINIVSYKIKATDVYYDDFRGTIKVSMWNGDTTDPDEGGMIADTDVTVAMPFNTTPGWQTIELASTYNNLAAGTYWMVVERAGGNYFAWVRDYDTVEDNAAASDADGLGAWTYSAADYYGTSEIWGSLAAGGLSISVAEAIAISETIGQIYDRWNLSASETISINEAVSAIFSMLQVTTSDTVKITEAITALFTMLEATTSESISINETINFLYSMLEATTSESITITDSAIIALTSLITRIRRGLLLGVYP